jgi:hypothetical protein
MAEQQNNRQLSDFERALSSLVPRGSGVNRDRLMFLAGQMSAAQPGGRAAGLRWLWPMATAISTAAALFLAAQVVDQRHRPAPQIGGPDVQDDPLATRDGRTSDDRPDQRGPQWAATPPGQPTPDFARDETRASWTGPAQLFELRRTILAVGAEGLAPLDYDSHRDRVVARSYWDESVGLRTRHDAGRQDDMPSAFANWTWSLIRGEPL